MMKRLVMIILLFFPLSFLAGLASAQSVPFDSTKNVDRLISASTARNFYKTLVVLNDKFYTADMKNIDPKDIASIQVFTGTAALAFYGSQADNCVLNIYTKHYNHGLIKKSVQQKSPVSDSILYVLDGSISDKNLNGVQVGDIVSRDSIGKVKVAEIFSTVPKNGLVVVLTKRAAIDSYQKKLSQFSQEYNAFLQINHFNDSNIVYMNTVNGIEYKQLTKDGINLLYKLSVDDIVKVDFSPRAPNAAGWKPKVLSITTKKID
jgi:hypothetical protein